MEKAKSTFVTFVTILLTASLSEQQPVVRPESLHFTPDTE